MENTHSSILLPLSGNIFVVAILQLKKMNEQERKGKKGISLNLSTKE